MNKPKQVFFNFDDRKIELLQISEKEMLELKQKHPINGVPYYFAYREKNPDGSLCDVPLTHIWPDMIVDNQGKMQFGELEWK